MIFKNKNKANLNQLHEVFKVHLFIDRELAVVVDDAVVLHLAIAAYTQGVVAGEVGALSHQEQARFRRVKQLLRLIPRYLPMKPSGSGRTREVNSAPKERDSVNTNLLYDVSYLYSCVVNINLFSVDLLCF